MGKKLTQKEYEQRVFEAVGDKYSVVSEYMGKVKPITLHCNIHNIDFSATAECFMRGPKDVRTSCPLCSEDNLNKNKVKVSCAYCGKEFLRAPSKLTKSKSGLYFCCREHKDLAQRIESGSQFSPMRPDHFDNGKADYRKSAFRHYEHKCAVCGYEEDERILQVHHRDENRENNSLDNLVILCPNCHWKITLHLYTLSMDNQLEECI